MATKKEVKKVQVKDEFVWYNEVEFTKIVKSKTSVINEQQLNMILQKTPANCRFLRPAKGGGKWEYVTGVYMKKVLNMLFGWNWDFEIREKDIIGEFVVVMGRLTCRINEHVIVKEQFGRAEIKFKKGGGREPKDFLDIGNDCKAAATDALKKCASEMGIAGDVYGRNEYKQIQIKSNEPEEGVFKFAGSLYESREEVIDAIKASLKTMEEVEELEMLLGVHPGYRKDAEILQLFEERKEEIERE